MIEDIPCVILAGGKSSRMFQNKAFLPFYDGVNLLEYQYHKMSKIFKNVFISTKIDIFSQKKCYLYENSEIFSPLVGISNAFKLLKEKKVFFIPLDTPFVKSQSIQKICTIKLNYNVIYSSTSNKSHFLVSLWGEETLEHIENALENKNYKISLLIEKMKNLKIEFEDELEFMNLNTPIDYNNALKLKENNG